MSLHLGLASEGSILPSTLENNFVEGKFLNCCRYKEAMAYIYRKVVGGKAYYYLRASARKGNKVLVKDIAYLGSSIKEAREALGKMPKFRDKIDKAYRKINLFLESNHFIEE